MELTKSATYIPSKRHCLSHYSFGKGMRSKQMPAVPRVTCFVSLYHRTAPAEGFGSPRCLEQKVFLISNGCQFNTNADLVGTPKYVANKMKSKGLQRLRWFCQVCEKQCRDENGFKCHAQSESHLRQMLVVGENAGKHIADFSSRFQHEFVTLLSRRSVFCLPSWEGFIDRRVDIIQSESWPIGFTKNTLETRIICTWMPHVGLPWRSLSNTLVVLELPEWMKMRRAGLFHGLTAAQRHWRSRYSHTSLFCR